MAELRRSETGKLACLENTGPYRDLGRGFAHVEEFLRSRGVPAKGDRLAVLYDPPLTADPERLHYAVALELAGETVGDGEVTIIVQPAGWEACETHRGAYDSRKETYGRLIEWIHAQGYRVAGPAREYYLSGNGPGGGGDESQAVTELHLPVEKIEA